MNHRTPLAHSHAVGLLSVTLPLCSAALGQGGSLASSTNIEVAGAIAALGSASEGASALRTPAIIDSGLSYAWQDPGTPGSKEPAGHAGDEDLAKKLSNPVSSLISVPFQLNFDKGYGASEADRWTLNIQPVIPFTLNEEWNLIVRTILPVIYQGSMSPGVSSDTGLGDTTQSFFFSPAKPVGGWIVGAGPVVLWPTGTDPALRSEQLGLGVTGVALRQEHGWTYGMLANQIWGVTSSDDHPEVNSTFLQPFVSYTWPTATSLTFNTESTYNWTAGDWTVPLNLMVAQIIKVGGQPVQLQLGGRYYAASPDGGPEWGMRFAVVLLFPK